MVGPQAQAGGSGGADGAIAEPSPADLAAEVERALEKVLRPSRQRPPYAMS